MIRLFTLVLLVAFSLEISAQEIKSIKEAKSVAEQPQEPLSIDLRTTSDFEDQGIDLKPIFHFTGRADLKTSFQVLQKNKEGQASFISGKLSEEKRSPNLKVQAKHYLDAVADVMEVSNEEGEFISLESWEDKLGHEHIKYQQMIGEVPIYGSEIILHAKDGVIHSLNGSYLSTKKIQPTQKEVGFDMDHATEIVNEKLHGTYRHIEEEARRLKEDFNQWEKQLVYYHIDGGLELAYHVKVYPHMGEWMSYFIDANSGKVLREYSNICKLHGDHSHHSHANDTQNPPDGPSTAQATDLLGQSRTINTYEVGPRFYLIDGSRTMFNGGASNLPNDPVGSVWTLDAFNTAPQNNDFDFDHVTSTANSWNKQETVSAHYNAGTAYEYFKNVHGRESIDGSGGNVISFVNVAGEDGSSMGNAFWNGIAIYYGNGDQAFFPLGRSLDVAGHEMSHGVVQATANLEYYAEPGAMNESFADIFGAMMDRDDWKIGEDVVRTSFFPSGALRDMEDPNNGGTSLSTPGWQPAHTDEQYTGTQDNAGVHINSGIVNKAYYLFATQIGKTKAEQVYYRALRNYLTKSSRFTDLRIAVVQSASDLYGSTESQAAQQAFDQVGIGAGSGGSYQQDANQNPGDDYVLYADLDLSNLYLATSDGNVIADPLVGMQIISKPSITDDGSAIVYVGADTRMYITQIDWTSGNFQTEQLDSSTGWRNVIVSKDGEHIATVREDLDNEIEVYSFALQEWRTFELYNPTYSEGVSTGDVLYSDVMEFDISGQYIMYDAVNTIQSQTAGSIDFWDIGFLEVWNKNTNNWASGNIEKAFPSLPEGVSVGNPTFAKNSPYIIAFDFIDEDGNVILATNLETGDVGLIYENNLLGYPSYASDDNSMVFDLDEEGYEELGKINVAADKITSEGGPDFFFTDPNPSQWGVWFSNGTRVLSDIEDLIEIEGAINIFPNPANDEISIHLDGVEGITSMAVYDMLGNLVQRISTLGNQSKVDVSAYVAGMYVIQVNAESNSYSQSFVVNR